MPFSTNVIYFASEGPPACNEPDRENRQCRKMSSVVALERPFKLRLSIHPFSDILFFTPMTSWKVWWNKRLLMVGSLSELSMRWLKVIKIDTWFYLSLWLFTFQELKCTVVWQPTLLHSAWMPLSASLQALQKGSGCLNSLVGQSRSNWDHGAHYSTLNCRATMLMLSSIELLCFLLPLSFFSLLPSWPLHREIFNRDFSSHHPSGKEEEEGEEEELLQGFQ